MELGIGGMQGMLLLCFPLVCDPCTVCHCLLALPLGLVLFVLKFYGPVNPMGSCRARSVYLTTLLLGSLIPASS